MSAKSLNEPPTERLPFPRWKPAKSLISAVAALSVFASALGADENEIGGEVFIVTKGAETIKLSLVNVSLFEAKAIDEHVQKKRENAAGIEDFVRPRVLKATALLQEAKSLQKAASDEVMKALDNQRTFHVEDFTQARKAEGEATDVVGQAHSAFLDLEGMADYPNSDDYYFGDLPTPLSVAKSDGDGKFRFRVKGGSYVLIAQATRHAGDEVEHYYWMVRVALDADKKVMLANDNLSSSGSEESVIHTLGDGLPIRKVIEGGGIDYIRACIERAKRRDEEETAKKAEAARQAELAEFRKHPEAAKARAAALFPDLAVAGSALNKEFVARFRIYQAEKKEFFQEPDWPIRLAKECSESLPK